MRILDAWHDGPDFTALGAEHCWYAGWGEFNPSTAATLGWQFFGNRVRDEDPSAYAKVVHPNTTPIMLEFEPPVSDRQIGIIAKGLATFREINPNTPIFIEGLNPDGLGVNLDVLNSHRPILPDGTDYRLVVARWWKRLLPIARQVTHMCVDASPMSGWVGYSDGKNHFGPTGHVRTVMAARVMAKLNRWLFPWTKIAVYTRCYEDGGANMPIMQPEGMADLLEAIEEIIQPDLCAVWRDGDPKTRGFSLHGNIAAHACLEKALAILRVRK